MNHKPGFVAFDILDPTGISIMQAIPELNPFIRSDSIIKKVQTIIELPPLIPMQYGITAWVGSHNTETFDQISNCIKFDVTRSPQRCRSFPHATDHGYVVPQSKVEIYETCNEI